MIVRSFLFNEYPYSVDRCKKEEIEEGYILEEPEMLVRRVDDEFFYITRIGEETVSKIGEDAYSFFMNNAVFTTYKTRYIVPLYDETVCNLDYYHGSNLRVASVEFDNEEDSEAFYPPVWFGEEVKGFKGLIKTREIWYN